MQTRWKNGVEYPYTQEELEQMEQDAQDMPTPQPTTEERLDKLEQSKAEQTAVDELSEALNMILEGVTE